MSRRSNVLALALGLMFALAASPPAAPAADRFAGVVLMSPSAGTIVVHHGPFAGMPAMTMTFTVPAGAVVHPGDRITADVDRSRDPWALANVRVIGAQTATPGSAPRFLVPGDRVPPAAFIDQRGQHLVLTQLAGAPYALTFVYTRCADRSMCPLVSAKFGAIAHTVRGIRLVEVSLDPAYDRPNVLARYGASYGADPARWHLLTGDPRAVLDFAARFGILERSAGPVTIVHSERLAIVDARGRIAQLRDGAGWSPGDVVRALQRLR